MIRRRLISILALLVALQIAEVVVVPLTLAFTTTTPLQSHASLSTFHNDALTTNTKKLLASGISYHHQHISIHNIKQLSYGNNNVKLNLVPISEAWDCNISHDKQQSAASLLPTLGATHSTLRACS